MENAKASRRWTDLLRDIADLETRLMDCAGRTYDRETRHARDLLARSLKKKQEELRLLI